MNVGNDVWKQMIDNVHWWNYVLSGNLFYDQVNGKVCGTFNDLVSLEINP